MIGFVVFSAIYVMFFIWARLQWGKIRDASSFRTSKVSTFSVIIPVRNEAANIAQLVKDLDEQDYPKGQFEVLLINDHSEDDTVEVARQAFDTTRLDFKIIALEDGVSGKKQAITRGVGEAQYDYIITTDGDCRVSSDWIAAYSDRFQVTDDLMLCGPVKMNSHNFFTRMQALEFSGLIGIGAASLQSGNPGMCNGANLAYQKAAFLKVKGYEGNQQIPSGDDEFLLQKIFKIYRGRVSYLKDQRAIVSTDAKDSFRELLNQRIRWSSKWRFHDSFFIKSMAISVFCNYAFLLYAVGATILGIIDPLLLGATFLVRWFAVLIFSFPVTRFLRVRGVILGSIVFEIIYPFFAVILGIASTFGKYSWKGRFYR